MDEVLAKYSGDYVPLRETNAAPAGTRNLTVMIRIGTRILMMIGRINGIIYSWAADNPLRK